MTIDAPELTQVINLLIAVGIFSSIVYGGLVKARSWQRKDVARDVGALTAPIVTKQNEIADDQKHLADKVDLNQKEMVDKFDRLNSAVLGHESRLSFVEGKEAGRVEGWTMRDRGTALRQIPEDET